MSEINSQSEYDTKVSKPIEEIEDVPMKKKRTRKMTPEMLDKLALAREKAMEKRRELGQTSRSLKSQKNKEYELNKKKVQYQDERLKKLEDELNAIKITTEPEVKPEIKKKKKKVIIEVSDSDSDSDSEEEVKVIKMKPKRKAPIHKKISATHNRTRREQIVESESESDSDSDEDSLLPTSRTQIHNQETQESVNSKYEKELKREKPPINMQLYRSLFPN